MSTTTITLQNWFFKAPPAPHPLVRTPSMTQALIGAFGALLPPGGPLSLKKLNIPFCLPGLILLGSLLEEGESWDVYEVLKSERSKQAQTWSGLGKDGG